MDSDDLYPSNGSYFVPREPKEQEIARKKEKAKTLEAFSVIQDVINHFDQRIADRDSLNAIKVDLDKDPALFQKVVEVNRLLKQALIEEKTILLDLLEVHAPNR